MKSVIISLLFFFATSAYAQVFKIRVGGTTGTEYDINSIPPETSFNQSITTFEIKKVAADNPAKTYKLANDAETKTFSTDGSYHSITFTNDVRDKGFSINDENNTLVGGPFSLKKSANPNPSGGGNAGNITILMPAQKTATDYLLKVLFPSTVSGISDVKGVGLKILSASANSKYTGTNYIHLFFDQNGNSLIHSIPIGIERANYVVHVIYLTTENNPQNIEYKVNQSAADIEEGVLIRSDGSLQNSSLHLQAADPSQKIIKLEWHHTEIALTGSSSDIKFDIVRSGFQITDDNLQALDPVTVASRTIKMKRIYHGSIDVGVLNTKVANPTYTLTPSDVDPNQMVVKKTNDHSRTLASAMYTFYLSPIVVLEKLFAPKTVENYKIEGRSFVDDHKIYERIYPTVGIGLNDRLLDNIFLGAKWEFVRGGSFFVGYNSSKINVLRVDESFKFEKDYMTQATFDLKKDTDWKGGLCLGLNLDVRIITNLFQTATSSSGQ